MIHNKYPWITGCTVIPLTPTGLLLSLLQNRGEHISEPELAEFLASLLEHNGTATNKEDKMSTVPASEASSTLETILPETIDADMFTGHVLGFQPALISEWYDESDGYMVDALGVLCCCVEMESSYLFSVMEIRWSLRFRPRFVSKDID